MSSVPLPVRGEIDKTYTWNAESVFVTPQVWQSEVDAVLAALPSIRQYQGRLSESPAVLLQALHEIEDLTARATRLVVYAGFAHSVDTTDQSAGAMNSTADGLRGQLAAASAFLSPELLSMGEQKLLDWMKSEPALLPYEHFVRNLFRRQANIRSAEVEEVIGMLADSFSGPSTSSSMLTNADLEVPPGIDSQDNPIEISEATLVRVMGTADRRARQTVWENYHGALLHHRNTLATNLASSIKQNVFLSRVRRHSTALEMMLSEYNIPVSVFHNLIETFRKHLPIWHHYFDIRRKALGVDSLQPYDMWAPLGQHPPKVSFHQAVDIIAEGLLPMGRDYVGILRNGCLEERWVDVYPNKGKRAGAFSWGSQGTHPFIMMSFTDDVISLSTLAHELGHSMHSYLTFQNQPFTYSDYSLFVAEVASNFHQAMVRAHLLKSNPDRDFQVAVIEEAMSNFYRYFFIMPTLARFELETHTTIEQNRPLTASSMIDLMADLFTEAFGGKVHIDHDLAGITWARFNHLYSDYYVYAYATGIAGANALASRVLRAEAGAVEDYLGFLKAGSSRYPLDVLKSAGVDLTTPAPVDAAFAVMSDYVDRLEKLLA